MSNLIQNYTNNINQGISSFNKTSKMYYNNLKSADSDNLLRPLDGKGYLVNESLTNAPKEFVKDTYYTTKALKKGLAGKANDNELGKMNDLGLKLGGLAIATYLMTRRATPKQKAMEFIGFGAFLASMALWPKIAIELPTRLRFGFNPRKQYYDEQGRKKFVTQDPNYIPFDLFKGKKANEDLGKIGDRMGISRTEKNRDEITKEQIRKISVQNNTLWMLTAGIATPVMTALACNRLEGPVGKFFEKLSNDKANKLAAKIEQYNQNGTPEASKILLGDRTPTKNEAALTKLLEEKSGKVITQEDVKNISKLLTDGLDNQTANAANRDLSYMLANDKTVVSPKMSETIVDRLTEAVDKKLGEGTTKGLISKEGLAKHIDTFMQGRNNPSCLDADAADDLRRSVCEYFQKSTETITHTGKRKHLNTTFGNIVENVFAESQRSVLTERAKKAIKGASQALNQYQAVDRVIEKVSHFKVEKAPETVVGNHWGELTDTLIKELGITPKEMKEAIGTQELSSQLFTRKLEQVVADPNKYEKLVRTLGEKVQELDIKVDNPNGGTNVLDTITTAICKNNEATKDALDIVVDSQKGDKPFYNLSKRFSGTEVGDVRIGSLREAQVNRIKQARVGGVQSAYMRLLKTIDFFKQAHEMGDSATPKQKAIFEKGKAVLMSAHSGEFYGKLQTNNFPQFYHDTMYAMLRNEQLSPATEKALQGIEGHEMFNGSGKIPMTERVKTWAKRVGDLMLEEKHDFLPSHGDNGAAQRTTAFVAKEKTAVEKFHKIGSAPAKMLYGALKNKHNSGLWLKFWGTVGAATLGVTLLAQLGFGKKDKSIKTTKQV